ncbi:uncharacterized protein UTRI_02381 [Ustilago trichophora]|uniref:Uncharacterized protein n=1 Tax=Ustilago trichophora TaxID=86804 RepID=A0A5C3E976_9BASI|nr:uncharacterized protein UTRI_02381 [Ustilago trichophora]
MSLGPQPPNAEQPFLQSVASRISGLCVAKRASWEEAFFHVVDLFLQGGDHVQAGSKLQTDECSRTKSRATPKVSAASLSATTYASDWNADTVFVVATCRKVRQEDSARQGCVGSYSIQCFG